jgi:hypothetical protein
MRCPTVRITNPRQLGDYIVINESDFDASRHELFDETKAIEKIEAVKAKQAAPLVTHEIAGNGMWVVRRGDEEIGRGRGKRKLEAFLEELEA